ncbi:ABC transporter substrate-binding protein [Ruania suaedae]|uniref:ABC transporter substrate-binding protein n=1 Tax=Ruania suaedae TaxID=2897774 RepID=UPI001E419B1C|nr:ABC transporter substrate-binding protein [Ruania suaedae]UFU03922.1 ABC transporter substrate-binding protein [Ruania suaedae]
MTSLKKDPRTPSRRRFGVAAFAAASLVALAACSDDGSAEPGGEDAGGEEPGTEEITLNFAFWGDTVRAERYEEAIELFREDYPNVSIETTYSGFGDHFTARNTEAASRSLPDIIQMDLAYMNEYADFGHLVPLDDYIGDVISVDAIDPGLVSTGEVDGSNYGIASASSGQAVYINEPLLDELGVEAPEAPFTWDEWDAFLAEVSAAGESMSPQVYGGIDYASYFWLFQVWLSQQGLSLVDGEQLGFTEADLAEWWSRSVALQESGATLPPDRLAQIEGSDAIGIGEVATDISFDNFLTRFSEGSASPELTMMQPPVSEGSDTTGLFLKPGLMMSIAANSEHPDEAAAFIDFIINDPEVGNIFGMTRGVPASATAQEGIEASGLDQEMLEYASMVSDQLDGTPPPAIQGLGTLEQTFNSIAQEVTYGDVPVDEAAERWFAEAENVLG